MKTNGGFVHHHWERLRRVTLHDDGSSDFSLPEHLNIRVTPQILSADEIVKFFQSLQKLTIVH